eukprot:369395-Amphidinium_carterae.1
MPPATTVNGQKKRRRELLWTHQELPGGSNALFDDASQTNCCLCGEATSEELDKIVGFIIVFMLCMSAPSQQSTSSPLWIKGETRPGKSP